MNWFNLQFKLVIFTVILIGLCSTGMASERKNHLLSVGQGVSSPSVTSFVNFAGGFGYENPVGSIYQQGLRISGQFDQNGNDGYGGEIGFADQAIGLAAGYYERDCENCEGDARGALGLDLGFVALGIRAEEDIYGLGLLFQPNGTLRIGVTATLTDFEDIEDDPVTYGVGFAYVTQTYTIAVDASKMEWPDAEAFDDTIKLTPGLVVRGDILQASINYDMYLEDEAPGNDDLYEDDLWFGIGVGGQKFHLAFYADFVNDIALVGSAFF